MINALPKHALNYSVACWTPFASHEQVVKQHTEGREGLTNTAPDKWNANYIESTNSMMCLVTAVTKKCSSFQEVVEINNVCNLLEL